MFFKVDVGFGFFFYFIGVVFIFFDVGVVFGECYIVSIVFIVFRVDQCGVLVWRNIVSWILVSIGVVVQILVDNSLIVFG